MYRAAGIITTAARRGSGQTGAELTLVCADGYDSCLLIEPGRKLLLSSCSSLRLRRFDVRRACGSPTLGRYIPAAAPRGGSASIIGVI